MVQLITTSIVSDGDRGESQGGVYIVDVEGQAVRQVMDCGRTEVHGQAYEWDRGPRGVAIDGRTVYITASDELFAFTPDLRILDSWRCPYLQNAQASCIHERRLYIASAGYDSVIAFDLDQKKFSWALSIDLDRFKFTGNSFDPVGDDGPLLLNKLHLNSVHANEHGLYIAGAKSGGMLHFNGEAINMSVTLPDGTHDAQPFRDGVLFNDSEADAVRYASRSGEEDRALKVPVNDGSVQIDDNGTAQQDKARGLCTINDRVVAAGSSPATIALHDLEASKTLLSVSLNTETRQAIHSIALWPF